MVGVRRRWQGRFTTIKGKRDQGTRSDLKHGPETLKVNSQGKKKDTGNHAHKRKTAQESRKRRSLLNFREPVNQITKARKVKYQCP